MRRQLHSHVICKMMVQTNDGRIFLITMATEIGVIPRHMRRLWTEFCATGRSTGLTGNCRCLNLEESASRKSYISYSNEVS